MELLQRGEPGSDKPRIPFELRMAVVYRSEKKKILISQINMIQKVLSVLTRIEDVLLNTAEDPDVDISAAYTALILEETEQEAEWRSQV